MRKNNRYQKSVSRFSLFLFFDREYVEWSMNIHVNYNTFGWAWIDILMVLSRWNAKGVSNVNDFKILIILVYVWDEMAELTLPNCSFILIRMNMQRVQITLSGGEFYCHCTSFFVRVTFNWSNFQTINWSRAELQVFRVDVFRKT